MLKEELHCSLLPKNETVIEELHHVLEHEVLHELVLAKWVVELNNWHPISSK